MLTTKKNNAMKTGGITAARSRGTPRSARPGDGAHVVEEARPVGLGVRRRCAIGATTSAMVIGRLSSGSSVALDVAAGQLEEDVVERGRAQGEIADRDLAAVQGDGDRADRGRTVVGGDHQLVAVRLDALHPGELLDDRRQGAGVSVDAGDDDVGADGALEILGASFGDDPTLVDDADPAAQLVGFLEVLGGEEDGHAQRRG